MGIIFMTVARGDINPLDMTNYLLNNIAHAGVSSGTLGPGHWVVLESRARGDTFHIVGSFILQYIKMTQSKELE